MSPPRSTLALARAIAPYALAILVGLWAHGAAIHAPLAVDDYAHEAMLDQTWPLRRAPWDLYNFVDGSPREVRTLTSAGLLPWWSHPALKFRFFRPLSSLLRALDHQLFGRDAVAPHAHSLAWWLLCCVGCALLFRRTLSAKAAPWALAFFAADASHTLPVGWLANRSFLVCAALGVLGLWRFHVYREEAKPRDAIAASLLFLAALAGGEYALTVLAYAAAHTLVARDARVSRAKSALVWLAPVALWASVYGLGGYGADHSDAYLDPIHRPAAFARAAPERMLAHLGELWFAVAAEEPPPWGWSSPRARLVGAALLLAIAAALYAVRPVPRSLRWLALGSLLALVPVLPSFGAARLQVGAQLGVSAIMATLLVRAFERLAERAHRRRIGPWFAALAAVALTLVHLPLTVILARHRMRSMAEGHRRALRMIQGAAVDREGFEQTRAVLLAAIDGQTLLYPPLIWRRSGLSTPRAWLGLTATRGFYRVRRTETSALLLEAFASDYLTHPAEMLFRPRDRALRPGDVLELDGLRITVEALHPVRRVSFHFREPLDPRSVRLLIMDAHGMREVPAPEVGRAMVIPEPRVPP